MNAIRPLLRIFRFALFPGLVGTAAFAVAPSAIAFSAPPSEQAFSGDEAVFRVRAVMPHFDGLERTRPDVCLNGRCPFSSVSAAAKQARSGAVLVVAPGRYSDCLNTRGKSLAIVGLRGKTGERPSFHTACGGKGAFVANGDRFLLRGIDISGIAVPGRNGACIRLEGQGRVQRAALVDVDCRQSENGVLGTTGQGSLIVRQSRFFANGANGGQAHGLYIHGGQEVVIDRSLIASTKGQGHSLKVGAPRLLVERSTLAALNGHNSRAIDFYGGGVLLVRASVLQQGPHSDNHDVIALGMEPRRANEGAVEAAAIVQSWVVHDDLKRCCRWLFQGTTRGLVSVSQSMLVGINGSKVPYQAGRGVKRFASRKAAGLPPFDGTLKTLPTAGAQLP